jgi:excisionase family DNA binding protein
MSTHPKGQTPKPETVGNFKSIAKDGQGVRDRAEEKINASDESVALTRLLEPSLVPGRGLGGSPSGLEAALLAFLQSKTSGSLVPVERVPVERRIFLTMTESVNFSGLPVAFLRRLITSGKLKALRTGAGWRIARTEIEKLSWTLTDARQDLTEHEIRDMEMNRRRRQET